MQPSVNTSQKPKKKLSKIVITIIAIAIVGLLLTLASFVLSTKNILSCSVLGEVQMNSKRSDIQAGFNSIDFAPGQESPVAEARVVGRDCVDNPPRITISKKIPLTTTAGNAYDSISNALLAHGYKSHEDNFARNPDICADKQLGVQYFSNHGQQVEVSISCANQSQEGASSWREIPATQVEINYRLSWYES